MRCIGCFIKINLWNLIFFVVVVFFSEEQKASFAIWTSYDSDSSFCIDLDGK